jgi:hypothetical protein
LNASTDSISAAVVFDLWFFIGSWKYLRRRYGRTENERELGQRRCGRTENERELGQRRYGRIENGGEQGERMICK